MSYFSTCRMLFTSNRRRRIGLLCLWFMIKKSTPQTAAAAAVSTEEAQIETAIARLGGVKTEMFSRMDEIVKRFYELSGVSQVKTSELVKILFVFFTLVRETALRLHHVTN